MGEALLVMNLCICINNIKGIDVDLESKELIELFSDPVKWAEAFLEIQEIKKNLLSYDLTKKLY